jgi:hypothetical protein
MMKPLDFRGAWLTPLLTLLAALVAGMLYAGVALAATVNEQEPNDTIAEAQNIDNHFSLDFDPDIGDTTTNTSEEIPHATVEGTGNSTVDVYEFTVSQTGRVILDVDYAFPDGGFDSYLTLLDSSGNSLGENDDSDPTFGAQGSVHPFDSYIEVVLTPGTYYVEVGSCCPRFPVPDGATYELQVSVEHHADEPDVPTTKDECKKGGWRNFTNPDGSPLFKNQGDCVSYVASKGKNQPSG